MIGVQLNATQRCNQPPADNIVHWRMADQVLEMYWVEPLMAGLGWWII